MSAPLDTPVDRRFALVREIARGGMGVVLEARHLVLRTPVAIKLLADEATTYRAARSRLMREAQVLALCAHPRVVRVVDAGTCAVHGPFVALEMIDGRSLESFVAAGRQMAPEAVAAIGAQLAEALAHVHAQGVVHRDVKPSNVLVSRGPGGDHLWLIDFGIAALIGDSQSREPKLTAVGELLGTTEFVAPEVLVEDAPATPAADVYSLGVLLFECLTGSVPVPGTPLAVISAHVRATPIPSLDALRPDLPPELSRAVVGALARQAADRPDAATLARTFAALAAGRPLALLDRAKGSEARTRRRAPYSAPVRVVTPAGPVDGRTEDISEGGALVVLSDLQSVRCDVGANVTIRLPLPSTGKVADLASTVRWVSARRGQLALGIEFDEVSEAAREELRQYVAIVGSEERKRGPLLRELREGEKGPT